MAHISVKEYMIKRASKTVKVVLQHCCTTSLLLMLHVLSPKYNPILQLAKSG